MNSVASLGGVFTIFICLAMGMYFFTSVILRVEYGTNWERNALTVKNRKIIVLNF